MKVGRRLGGVDTSRGEGLRDISCSLCRAAFHKRFIHTESHFDLCWAIEIITLNSVCQDFIESRIPGVGRNKPFLFHYWMVPGLGLCFGLSGIQKSIIPLPHPPTYPYPRARPNLQMSLDLIALQKCLNCLRE